MIDEKRLEAIECRSRHATPGPWETFQGDDLQNPEDYDGPYPKWRGVIPSAPGSEPVVERCKGDGYTDSILNTDFIAHARQDVPDLVAEVRRLRPLAVLASFADHSTICPSRDWNYTGDKCSCGLREALKALGDKP
jgi:hypothetical protein